MANMPTVGTINQPSTVSQDQAQQIQQMIAALQNQNPQQYAQNQQNAKQATSSINSAPIASPAGAGGVLGTFLLNQLAKQGQLNPNLFNSNVNPDYLDANPDWSQ